MLPACARMRRRRDFDATVRRGRRTGRALLVAHLGDAADDLRSPQVGFVVSRAVGNAPTRNLVRRRLRHLTSDRLDALPENARLVVRAKPPAARAGFDELGTELDVLLGRLLTRSPDGADRR
ncbi:MAG: ribonuclease P protein component [Streptosporangiales bacterium]|nr:ribonuclease P protein component [Streptosporangiales bacterium]